MNTNRREFLRMAGTVSLSAGLPCSAAALAGPGPVHFPQGVASGDPSPDSVYLWTRAEHRGDRAATALNLVLQVATDADFTQLVVEESLRAVAANDFTVRAHVDGLDPGRHYHYRFLARAGGQSRSGRTLTAPDPTDPRPTHLAFASCQNYEQGYFGAWGRMLTEDLRRAAARQIQFVLHLGDFIYERYNNGPRAGQAFARRLPALPDGAGDGRRVWAESLADYRHLYKVYLSDPHLQAARARWPFICTWDDHEFSNDNFRHFSTYDSTPKPELQRRRNAQRAWFDYIPARVPAAADLHIYRKLRWGKHTELLLTDLRSYRSAPPLPPGISKQLGLPADPVELVEIFDAGAAWKQGKPPRLLPFGTGSMPNTARHRAPGSLMGARQKQWFKQGLRASTARWKLWGNSLPALPLRMNLAALPGQDLPDLILSEDAWSGFPLEYRELMDFLRAEKITGVVSLSGDHHMHGAGTLASHGSAAAADQVAVDFNVSGISSTPHFDNVLHTARKGNSGFLQLVAAESDGRWLETWNMTLTQGVLAALAFAKTGLSLPNWLAPNAGSPGLHYIDSNSNGYGLASFDERECRVELVTTAPARIAPAPAGSEIKHRARFSLPAWAADSGAALQGPVFEGTAPFPW